jgi:hypothetical protein
VDLLVAGEQQADDQAFMRQFGSDRADGLRGFFGKRFPVLRFGPGDSMSISRVSIDGALERVGEREEGNARAIALALPLVSSLCVHRSVCVLHDSGAGHHFHAQRLAVIP